MENKNLEIFELGLALKKLNIEKMGDVGIRNEDGTNIIFHTNKINIKKFKQFEKKQLMVGTPNSYTQAQSLDERLVQKHISSPAKDIIAQNFDTEIKSIENTLTSKSSIAQKEKALNKLEKMNNYALNAKQKLMIEKLQNQYLKKGVSK